MTAPAAPTIRVRSDGTKAYIRWQPVAGATTYNLYASDVSPATTQVQSGLVVAAGQWGQAVLLPVDMAPYIRLTAVNAGAEESAASNEVRIQMDGGGHRLTGDRSPFG